MRMRYRAILSDLERFRCLARDDIAAIHFRGNKVPIKATNEVMRRLRDRGEVELVTTTTPYVYAVKPSPLRKDSQKVPHYLAIAGVYREMLRIGPPRIFQVEPKYGKGLPEPDIFTIWAGRAFWIEVQRNVFSAQVWQGKFQRYINFFRNGRWREESWQPKDKKVFPYVLILSSNRVFVPNDLLFPVLQGKSISELFTESKIHKTS
ncbi:hypothetical protein ACI7RC_26055 [Brevibacillus sp. B_LB10_24]|uniref:hypothetical protein n=1 Tax=Brevibacillus sp. B_LB10_24 TaxID=3380645 RepID=UPI0038BBF7EE